jgi:hypothetical protein
MMNDLNLVLKFKMAGDSELRVRSARSIKLDGRGGLIVEDAETNALETIDLRNLTAFNLQSVVDWQQWTPASVL